MTTAEAPIGRSLLTIGAVCRLLKDEFPDISISKIRYLEDQRLLEPKRTQGGYRLFGEDDVDRLRTILRLQRDEFLPLRVIRQELKTAASKERRRRRPTGLESAEDELTLDELCERAGISQELARDLESYGLLEARRHGAERLYAETDIDIAMACAKLARFGIGARHLRTFRTIADREAGLLQQLVAPALRSRNADHRKAAMEDLQMLAELSQELSQLLFWRDLRRVAGT